ncbi:spike base protein, RCAP_Rcc01079 family [Xanthobacter wiegelii]|uniref:spike base protein, RCAP_Rcc01079 family n=1 Tax=Xanthobacter wiegelii TaxID=3119913 RepID=UPI003729478A
MDPHADEFDAATNLGRKARNVTPSGSDVDLDPIPKTVVCLTSGTLAYVPVDNDDADVVSLTVPPGFVALHRPRRIKSTTTCTVWTVE